MRNCKFEAVAFTWTSHRLTIEWQADFTLFAVKQLGTINTVRNYRRWITIQRLYRRSESHQLNSIWDNEVSPIEFEHLTGEIGDDHKWVTNRIWILIALGRDLRAQSELPLSVYQLNWGLSIWKCWNEHLEVCQIERLRFQRLEMICFV